MADVLPPVALLLAAAAGGTDGEDLAVLEQAKLLAGELDQLREELLTAAVDRARAGGASWSEVGTVLSVSRQAAQQRYGASGSGEDIVMGRLDDQARLVIADASDRAAGRPGAAIEAGDVFLAAVNCSTAVRADLVGLGVDAAALCGEVASVLPARRRGRRPRVMAFSQNVVTALRAAAAQAHGGPLTTALLVGGLLELTADPVTVAFHAAGLHPVAWRGAAGLPPDPAASS